MFQDTFSKICDQNNRFSVNYHLSKPRYTTSKFLDLAVIYILALSVFAFSV